MNPKFAVFVQDLTVAYDQKPVLWDVDFYAPYGSLTAIIGPNGAGKSTLLKSILDLVQPATGSIQILGDTYQKNKLKVAYVPQKTSVDWSFPITVFDIVLMGRYGHLHFMQRPSQKDKEIALQALEQVKMLDFKDRHISQLSGGQQQRVFLARALAQKAELYCMDEPFNGIDTASEDTILHVLHQLKEQNKTIIVVHHNLSKVLTHFDWVALINTKHIAIGPTKQTLTKELITSTFNITDHDMFKQAW